MKRNWKPIGASLEWCGTLCLVAVTLPVLAVAAFILRGLLLAAALTALVAGAFVYWLNPRFRAWVDHRMGVNHSLLTHGIHGRVRH